LHNPPLERRFIAVWQTSLTSPPQTSIARKNRQAPACRAVGELPLRFKLSQSSFRPEDAVS